MTRFGPQRQRKRKVIQIDNCLCLNFTGHFECDTLSSIWMYRRMRGLALSTKLFILGE